MDFKLGLYSELARQDIVKARNYISSKKIQTNKDNIHDFRQKIISGELSHLNSLKNKGLLFIIGIPRSLLSRTRT